MSCVGLLATTSDKEVSCTGGYLWLVDETGAYRTRAHAVGGGITKEGRTIASLVNEQLCSVDFSDFTTQEGAKQLLAILSKNTVLSSKTRVEIASTGTPQGRRIKRLLPSPPFGIPTLPL